MADFKVQGPFVVPTYSGANGRIVRAAEGDEFFQANESVGKARGCYVFGIRSGGGITPVYVGKATKSFKQECFRPHKLGKLNEALVDCRKGRLVVFFVVAPSRNGPTPSSQISALECFLIDVAVAKNPQLLNVKGTKRADWSILGVVRAKKGKPSLAATKFRGALGILSVVPLIVRKSGLHVQPPVRGS